MRGHEALIEARLQGLKPAFVFINDYPCLTDWNETGDHCTINTAGKALKSLDLRFLRGLKVSIASK